jgi:hypothetical protein
MRIGSFLLVAIGIVCAACTATTSADIACQAAGGVCIALPEGGGPAPGCGEQMVGQPCDPGAICCTGTPVGAPVAPSDAAYGTTTTFTDAAVVTDAGTAG